MTLEPRERRNDRNRKVPQKVKTLIRNTRIVKNQPGGGGIKISHGLNSFVISSRIRCVLSAVTWARLRWEGETCIVDSRCDEEVGGKLIVNKKSKSHAFATRLLGVTLAPSQPLFALALVRYAC